MIYILTLSKICPGEPVGFITDLFEDAFLDLNEAEEAFKNLPLSPLFFKKELWCKNQNGKRVPLKEEQYTPYRKD